MELPAGVTTRPLRPDDARAVFDLMVDSQTLDAGDPSVDLEDVVGDWQRPSFDLATHAVGVKDEGRLVGYAHVANGRYADAVVASTHRGRGIGTWLAGWTQAEDCAGPAVFLAGVAVLERARRRGIAAAMSAWLLEQAFAAGARLAHLHPDTDAAGRVYSRLGFTPAGALDIYVDV